MMIDRSILGHVYPPRPIAVERGAIVFFARATGETNPIHFDTAAAQAAGYTDVVAPATFVFSLNSMAWGNQLWVEDLKVDLSRILHAEQHFESHRPIIAGDRLAFTSTIADLYAKKGGALEFVVQETLARGAAGELVAKLKTVLAVRHG